MAEESEQAKNEHVPGKKKQDKFGKYKWYVIAGLAAIAALVFFFTSKNKSSSGQSSQDSQNPGMTVPPGGGFVPRPGPRGPAGATGARGRRGQRGRRGRRGR